MSRWGPLAGRYETKRPRKLLALDGGGIRGIMTLEILDEIERQLRKLTRGGDAFRLCDFFDYIGGTSTGAILAAGLARGMSTAELLTFYQDVGPKMFDKTWLLRRLKNLYKAEPLAEQLKQVFGSETDLAPEHLRCLILAVTRNVTTDSPWPISSNPNAKYNDPERSDCNLRIPLWQLVRASTAAPVFFPPEVLQWDRSDPEKSFVFVDGGVTPYNNPAFLLYRMATLPAYRLGWPTGEGNLMLVSVGTGAAPATQDDLDTEQNVAGNLVSLPSALMYAASVDQDVSCRTVGRCVHGAVIDREIGDLIPRDERGEKIPVGKDLGRGFLYARYNADTSAEGLAALGLGHIEPKHVQQLASVDHIPELRELGRKVAESVQMSDFGDWVA